MTGKNRKGIGFYPLYGATYLMAMLPFRVLYILSDVLYIVVYYLVGYRRKIVRKNLLRSFPRKKEEEILQIGEEIYRHCVITLWKL